MSKQIQVVEHESKFILLGEDGYTTSQKKYKTKELAESARAREQKLVDGGKNSRMRWTY